MNLAAAGDKATWGVKVSTAACLRAMDSDKQLSCLPYGSQAGRKVDDRPSVRKGHGEATKTAHQLQLRAA